MVVHGEEVAGQGVVCDLHLHVVVDAVGKGRERDGFTSTGNWKAAGKKGRRAGEGEEEEEEVQEVLTRSSWRRGLCVSPPCETGSSFHRQSGWPCRPGPAGRRPARKPDRQTAGNPYKRQEGSP